MGLSRRGRKITTWTFNINRVPVEVEVKIRRQQGGSYMEENSGEFFVKLQNGDTVVNTDIDELRKEVRSKLKERMELEWNLFLEIKAERHKGDSHASRGSGVEMSYRYVAIAERDDQEDLYRYINDHRVDDGTWAEVHETLHQGRPKVWSKHTFGLCLMTSVLPCTPDRVDALELLLDRFDALWDTIEERFAPEKADQTLKEVAQNATNLLLSPVEEEQ